MKSALLYVVIGALAILLVLEKCKPDPKPIIDPAIITANEDLKRESARKDSIIAHADSVQEVLRVLAQSQAERARNAERTATVHRRAADSARAALAVAATAEDSIPPLLAVVASQAGTIAAQDTVIAFQKARIETDSSRILLLAGSLNTMTLDRDDWRVSTDRWERVARDIEDQLNKSRRWPSKTESYLLGVVSGAALIVGIVAVAR